MFNFLKPLFSCKTYKSSFEDSLQEMKKNCEYMKSLASTLPDSPGKQKFVHALQKNSQSIDKIMSR